MQNIINIHKLATTTLAPAGIEKAYEQSKPAVIFITARIAEHIVTLKKLLKTRIEVSAGKIIRLEINIAPIIFIPSTTVTAVKIEISVLYIPTFTPVAFEKLSSKVTAKIL